MPQSFPLDPSQKRSYYPAAVLGLLIVGGCVGLKSIAPKGLAPISPATASGWAAELVPASALQFDLKWRFRNQKGSTAGRAVVRIAPPDTLRFDYRGPFGKSGSAVVIGDAALWARPEQDFQDLIPVAPLFWAALGIPIGPAAGAEVVGRDGPDLRAWRYVTGNEELDFVLIRDGESRLLSELRRGDRILGATEVRFETESHQPKSATMVFPGTASRFSFTIEAIDTVDAFAPETWNQN